MASVPFDDLNEKLFRAVWPYEKFWKKNGRVSSAAFEDPKGLSVERASGRCDGDVVKSMTRYSGGIVSVTVGQCQSVSASVIHDPIPASFHHSQIHGSTTERKLKEDQMLRLARFTVLQRDRY